MSGSEDTSDFNTMSPLSQASSPYSSPSQQVPHLANYRTEVTCAEASRSDVPFLQIIEEPMNHFRFRYKSEMIGTHGCLLGISHQSVRAKTHPTVELRNYRGRAEIRCTLVRHDNNKEHPHKLQDDHEREVNGVVPDSGSYKVAFSGMGIIHTAKKDVPSVLFKKKSQEAGSNLQNEEMLRVKCESEAREINLNIVRLKFTAHDLVTKKEICNPVYSKPIHNLKSAATNDLKICRMSRSDGRACGGDDVFLLVEKVKKTNIMIRFFELDDNGHRTWSAKGAFLQTDVHHQYAIVFHTPPYKDTQIKSDVTVYIELVRPSDGRTSEPKSFTYRAHPIHKQSKKRKANSFSSLESNSSSLRSMSDLPVTISLINETTPQEDLELMQDIPTVGIKIPGLSHESPLTDNLIGDAMLYDLGTEFAAPAQPSFSSMLAQPKMNEPPVLHFNSSEIARLLEPSQNTTLDEKNALLLEPSQNITLEETKMMLDIDIHDYFSSFNSDLAETVKCIKNSLVGDSGRAKPNIRKKTPTKEDEEIKETKPEHETKGSCEYTAYYKAEDGTEVKKSDDFLPNDPNDFLTPQLVKEICEIIRNKSGFKKQLVRAKLERLFDMRLSNGDTFLHMTLCSNQPSLEYIVKLVHSMKMTRLLNLGNNQMQTILHVAVINDSSRLVSFLVSKGCDPMLQDIEGNNAVHCAVIGQTCLEPLLAAIKSNDVACDLDACNNETQSALHLAALYGDRACVRTLLQAGAALDTRDSRGRTPLHLAALAGRLPLVWELLNAARPGDIDAVDAIGYTALQMVCDASVSESSLEIVKLLLDNKADPLKHNNEQQSAYKLARNKPELMELLRCYVSSPHLCEDDIKSEPEDEYESVEEDMEDCGGLPELRLYVGEVAAILDESGAWRELARRVSRDTLLSWYSSTPSPTATLLNNIKTYDETFTSRSLALLLEDMGQVDAANIIRRYIPETTCSNLT